ncbi:apicoplast RNA methyltransferase precursor, putative [Plasmodium knowlesi strain H]|uniref:rRNA methyltransferase 1, mitochondrial n=1 Tax=Plasmodium knowlesi (strain H) TaxID=5851 RepID=A0A1A7VN33_PLAKH|nr:apicoplast RNA methyltransferase precursor, putative [Plasmodium knowlesi strain H]SBO24935.1 apicoplast RNA methyltransferase precursor, putative [Plasmodium knowlesi strain H]
MRTNHTACVLLLFLRCAEVTPFGILPEFRPNLPPRHVNGRAKTTHPFSSPHRNGKSDTPSVNIKRNNFLDAQAENNVDYVYGVNSVSSVLVKNERTIHSVLVNEHIRLNKKTRKQAYQYIFDTIKKRNIPIRTTSKKKMDDLVGGFPHNDIIMETTYRTMKKAKHFLKDYPQKEKRSNIYICLHDVYDNMNIGNICRSIFFFGGDTIFLKKKKKKKKKLQETLQGMKIDTPVLHSSVGTSEFLDFFHVNNMLTFMDDLKSCGFKILSTCCHPNDSIPNDRLQELANVQMNKNEKIFIILGNETKGLSKEILEKSDICIYINGHRTEVAPTPDLNHNGEFTLDSLNVNNACAILLHHFTSHSS